MAVSNIQASSAFSLQFQATETQSTSVQITGDNSQLSAQIDQADAVSISLSLNMASSGGNSGQTYRPGRLERAQHQFETLDTDQNGTVSQDELQAAKDAKNAAGAKTPYLDHVLKDFSTLDQNGDGELSFEEMHPRMSKDAQSQQSMSISITLQEVSSTSLTLQSSAQSDEAATTDTTATTGETAAATDATSTAATATGQSSTSSASTSSTSSSSTSSSLALTLDQFLANNSTLKLTNQTELDLYQPESTSSTTKVDANQLLSSVLSSVLPSSSSSSSSSTSSLDGAVQSYVIATANPKSATEQTLEDYGLETTA